MEGQHGCPNLHRPCGLKLLARAAGTANRGKRKRVKDADNNIGDRNFWEVVIRPNVQDQRFIYQRFMEQSRKRCVIGDTLKAVGLCFVFDLRPQFYWGAIALQQPPVKQAQYEGDCAGCVGGQEEESGLYRTSRY